MVPLSLYLTIHSLGSTRNCWPTMFNYSRYRHYILCQFILHPYTNTYTCLYTIACVYISRSEPCSSELPIAADHTGGQPESQPAPDHRQGPLSCTREWHPVSGVSDSRTEHWAGEQAVGGAGGEGGGAGDGCAHPVQPRQAQRTVHQVLYASYCTALYKPALSWLITLHCSLTNLFYILNTHLYMYVGVWNTRPCR